MNLGRLRLMAGSAAFVVLVVACDEDGTVALTLDASPGPDTGQEDSLTPYDASVGSNADAGAPGAEDAGEASDGLLGAAEEAEADAVSPPPFIIYCDASVCDWTQWAHDSRHTASTGAVGQRPERLLAEFVFDPFVAAEQAESGGELHAHYQTPLLVGDDVYMVTKSGTYVSCTPPGSGHLADGGTGCGAHAWDTEVWTETHLRWGSGQLAKQWAFTSDWKPVPAQIAEGWEPVFQPAISGAYLYVPGAGGALWKIDRTTGAIVAHVEPFGATVDPNTYAAGGLTVDPSGNVLYDALRLDPSDLVHDDATGWLVKVTPTDTFATTTFGSLVPDAPTTTCVAPFSQAAGYSPPYPPAPDDSGAPLPPPTVACLSQRPGLNEAPAVGADGTIFVVSRAHADDYASYLVAVTPDLTPKWDVSLAGALDDGCGVREPSQAVALPEGGVSGVGCRVGATQGVDPLTNEPPAARVFDLSSSSPVALPDGSVVYGAYTQYNSWRGHLMHFGAGGQFLGSYDFGWDLTPAVYAHDGTYSLVLKDNHYFDWLDASARGPYAITRIDAGMGVEWSHDNTNTLTCSRNPDASVTCIDDHPHSFEWCVNAPAIDQNGLVYATSEDGNLYILHEDGTEATHVFLQLALGAAYTPVALDSQGRIYALNGGVMRVLGQ